MNFSDYFFASEFFFRDEDDSRRRQQARQEPQAFVERCKVCGRPLVFGRDSSVVHCPNCDTDFATKWSKKR